MKDSASPKGPRSDENVKQMQKNGEPGTKAQSTKWALKLRSDWAKNRKVKHGDSPYMPPHLLSFEKINKWMCVYIYIGSAQTRQSRISTQYIVLHCMPAV